MPLTATKLTPEIGVEITGLSRHQLIDPDVAGMLHRAMPFEPTSPRLLHRTAVVGTEAVA